MSTVETPPPYDTAVINVQNNAKTSSNVYPSLLSFLLVQKAAVSVHTKGTQRGGAQYNQGPPRGGPKMSGVSLLQKVRALCKVV